MIELKNAVAREIETLNKATPKGIAAQQGFFVFVGKLERALTELDQIAAEVESSRQEARWKKLASIIDTRAAWVAQVEKNEEVAEPMRMLDQKAKAVCAKPTPESIQALQIALNSAVESLQKFEDDPDIAVLIPGFLQYQSALKIVAEESK